MFATLVAFASCKKENNDTPGTEPEGVPTQMSFSIEVPGATRAIDFPDSTPNSDERIIRNIAVLIYNSSRILETAHVEVFDQGDFKNGSYTATVNTKTGRHYVYAIASVPALLYDDAYSDAFSEGGMETILTDKIIDLHSTIPGLNKMATIKTLMGQENLNVQGGFFMMSQTPYTVDFIENPDNNSSINHITLPVVRALSKVTVGFEPQQSVGGDLTEVNYKVINNPSTMYVIPNTLPLNSNIWITPNYYNSQQWPTPSVEAKDYLDEPAHDYQAAMLTGETASSATFTYCMENSNYVALEGNTTCAVIRAKFNPESARIVDKNGLPSSLNPDGDFWLVAENNGSGIYDVYDISKFYSEEPDASVLNDYNDAKLIFYKEGICYYALWLRNRSALSYGENEWTVRRNHYYRVTINSVGGPGKSTDDGEGDDGGIIDPEVPLDGETTIRANIVVTNWTTVDQSGGI
ncbi:MAG: Mfa1 family fimbria major subunit [Alistipes sp.]|nr:Mfa1 family fimbria major subunit [Alistipes sp.]